MKIESRREEEAEEEKAAKKNLKTKIATTKKLKE